MIFSFPETTVYALAALLAVVTLAAFVMAAMLILLARRHGGCRKLWGKHDPNAAEQSAEYANREAFSLQDQHRTGPQGVSPTGNTASQHDLMSTKTTDNIHEAELGNDTGKPDQFSAEYQELQEPVSQDYCVCIFCVLGYAFLYPCMCVYVCHVYLCLCLHVSVYVCLCACLLHSIIGTLNCFVMLSGSFQFAIMCNAWFFSGHSLCKPRDAVWNDKEMTILMVGTNICPQRNQKP